MLAALLAMAVAATAPAALEVRRLPAPEAHQGVAAGPDSVYAVDNSRIARYDLSTGRRVAIWNGDPARFKHVNSCTVLGQRLVCAASNYPDVPMTSTVLQLDAKTLELLEVRELRPGYGSLTWLDWHRGTWWACFAHYDGKGGEPGRGHRDTVLVRYRADFSASATFRFPNTVLARFAPRSSSGGAWSSDGLLYITGHDLPELYVLRLSSDRKALEHVTTIVTPTGGQAVAWDKATPRLLWSIDRSTAEMVASKVPAVRH